MKFSKIALIGILALMPLMACSALTNGGEAAALSLSSTTVAQASTVKAAGDLYVLAAKAATAYLKSGVATKAQVATMVTVEGQVYSALIAARKADAKGDSPALAAALTLFNQNYASLAALVPGLGGQ